MEHIKTKNVLSLAVVALASVSLAGTLTAKEAKADQAQMIDAPKAVAGANYKIPGKYSWGPKVTKGITQPIPFGGNSDDWANSQTSDGAKYNVFKLAGNDGLKGRVGMLYRNVGIYNGHTIDLKLTLMDWDITFANVSDAKQRENDAATAYAAFGTEKFSIFDPGESALKYRVDFLDHTTGKPVKVTGLWTFADIDANQHLIFDNNTMDIIDNDIYAGDAKDSNDTWLSYKKMYGTNDFYSDANLHNLSNPTTKVGTVTANDRRGMLTTTFSDTDHFTMIWAYGNNTGKHVLESQQRVMNNPKFFQMTGKYIPDAEKNKIDKIYNYVDASRYAHAYLEFGGKGITAQKPAEPRKYDSDSDEGTNIPAEIDTVKSVDHDMLKNRYEPYHYQFVEDVPDVLNLFKFTKFQFTDQIDKVLDASNVHVYNRANQDVTNDFTVDIDSNNKLTVTAKEHALARDDFYREQYKINFDAKIKPGVSLADHADPKHKNQAVIYNQVTVDNGFGTAESNKTTTNVELTKAEDKKAVSQDGNGKGDQLNTEFDKDFKFTVDATLPDNENMDKFTIEDKLESVLNFAGDDSKEHSENDHDNEINLRKNVQVIDLDDGNKDITDQGNLSAVDHDIKWTAKDAKKWHGKHLRMFITASVSNKEELMKYVTKDGTIKIPNVAKLLINDDPEIKTNVVYVTPNPPKASVNKKIEVYDTDPLVK